MTDLIPYKISNLGKETLTDKVARYTMYLSSAWGIMPSWILGSDSVSSVNEY